VSVAPDYIADHVPRPLELYPFQWPSYSERMHRLILFSTMCAVGLTACARDKRYPLIGQVIAVNTERQELTVKHEDIRGFMPGMTMPFRVKNPAQVAASRPGDLITATLVVRNSLGYLDEVTKTGEAPLPPDEPHARKTPTIAPGDEVPEAELTDQDGRRRRLSDWRGKTIAVTFVYTRCPLPTFCPVMDRHFAAAQKVLKSDAGLSSRVHLLSISFDPDYDTPAVLKAHAARVGADPETWSYLTGSREGIDRLAAGFGITIMREDGTMDEIIHNLRTAVIAADGRLVNVLNGNDWQPEQLLAEIRAADARR
jgi:protein SCO1